MNRVISLSIAILVILNTPTQAETHVVPDDYATIQQAIDDSNDGDVIIVDPGTYSENINFSGKNIVLTSADPNNPEIVADRYRRREERQRCELRKRRKF